MPQAGQFNLSLRSLAMVNFPAALPALEAAPPRRLKMAMGKLLVEVTAATPSLCEITQTSRRVWCQMNLPMKSDLTRRKARAGRGMQHPRPAHNFLASAPADTPQHAIPCPPSRVSSELSVAAA